MQGRVALVTGGGSGLGAAICARLAADGVFVVVTDIDMDAAAKVAGNVGGEAKTFDVADAPAFDAAVDEVVAAHGKLDILVNNAGIQRRRVLLFRRDPVCDRRRPGGLASPSRDAHAGARAKESGP